ncbi:MULTISPECIES: DUF167 family protein [unclassified Caulobacter]|uniref:DUF167 family protein n=1 Tax=unclassified Caulobacter TaxID=2648921 RepID=UPI000D39178C|nr:MULTISPECIES: DUF167 family protein [unclassified Caulobacter]PTS88994.1 hypothetical protein DBR21_07865 [Caulobacter sp. HMWF009]PTT13065.1 hypothetical protein DBR10_00370 [Caulobacter sp. HMWF025]PTT79083.1 hypothetical protein DBR41_22240 [Pseudomonas sp. HMWF010]
MQLAVRLTPRGGRDSADGWARDADGRPYLKVRVSSPPVEGEANAALIAFLAKALGVPRSSIRLAAGASARLKRLDIEGVEDADLVRVFGPQI